MGYTIAVPIREAAERFRELLALKAQEYGRFDIEEIEPPAIEILGVRSQGRGDVPRLLVCLRRIRLRTYPSRHSLERRDKRLRRFWMNGEGSLT